MRGYDCKGYCECVDLTLAEGMFLSDNARYHALSAHYCRLCAIYVVICTLFVAHTVCCGRCYSVQ